VSIDQSILDRIAKLLRLAGDKGATEDEAATALEMAHKILESHNLDMSQVEARSTEKKAEGQVGRTGITVGKWEVDLFTTVAKHNYCMTLRAHRFNLTLVGRPMNIEATKIMFTWIKDQAERFWREEFLRDPRNGTMNWRTYKAGFYRGFTAKLYRRLQRVEVTQEVSTMAMVRVDENLAFVGGKVRKGYRGKRQYDEQAVGVGWVKGDDATLIKQGELTEPVRFRVSGSGREMASG